MTDIYRIKTITQAHQSLGLDKPKHPLVTVARASDFNQVSDFKNVKVIVDFYQIMYKDIGCGKLKYGRNSYDYEEGTLLFTAPGQVIEYDNDFDVNNNDTEGWILAFHPDLIRKSELGEKINNYSYFNYDVSEALHLSDEERATIEDITEKIIKEYSQNLDAHSQNLIIRNIELFLDYCLRFYDRQFYTRTNINSDIVTKFEKLLKGYYESEKILDLGIPSVNFLSGELNLSANYLSDLLKKETGNSAQEHIHLFIIEKAKNHLLNSSDSVSEIGYALGFEYPQYFSNLFKSKTGLSPREYRNLN
jgi:AraC-like DNA-binding protein